MPRYHINPETGRANICRARTAETCTVVVKEGKHFESKSDAFKEIERIAKEEGETLTKISKKGQRNPPPNDERASNAYATQRNLSKEAPAKVQPSANSPVAPKSKAQQAKEDKNFITIDGINYKRKKYVSAREEMYPDGSLVDIEVPAQYEQRSIMGVRRKVKIADATTIRGRVYHNSMGVKESVSGRGYPIESDSVIRVISKAPVERIVKADVYRRDRLEFDKNFPQGTMINLQSNYSYNADDVNGTYEVASSGKNSVTLKNNDTGESMVLSRGDFSPLNKYTFSKVDHSRGDSYGDFPGSYSGEDWQRNIDGTYGEEHFPYPVSESYSSSAAPSAGGSWSAPWAD